MGVNALSTQDINVMKKLAFNTREIMELLFFIIEITNWAI